MGKVPINYVYCDEQSLWQKSEFHVNIDNPVNQNTSVVLGDMLTQSLFLGKLLLYFDQTRVWKTLIL